MSGAPQDGGWAHALARYDELIAENWTSLSSFRQLVLEISQSPAVSGLVAVTSMSTLLISPYTCYPDWFAGRHVCVHPLPDERVQLVFCQHEFDPRPGSSETVPIEHALPRVLRLLSEL